MSATLTRERVTYDTVPYVIRPLGYLFCGGCVDPTTVPPGELREFTPREAARTDDSYHECDRCHERPPKWPIFTNTGWADVEHTPVRIF